MKIAYFYQYFTTPKGSYGTRVYEFTKEWVEKGHDVTIITSIYSKSDLEATAFIENQVIDGINVKIINVRIDNKQSILKRIWTFILYVIIANYYALTIKADVIIASSGPITVGITGVLAKIFRSKKVVFEVRDLWPEGAIELGIIKNKLLKKVTYWFERLCYKKADLIVALSPGMKSYIEDNHQHKNVISVTNSANIQLFSTPTGGGLPEFYKDKRVLIYTGNIGMVNNSMLLFNTAKVLKQRGEDDLLILLVGDGQQKAELLKLKEEQGVDNFIIHDLIPKNQLVAFVQNAMASIIPLKGTPVLDTSSPNKLFESLAAGVPVIQTTKGWIKDYLSQNNVGFTVEAHDPEELADLLIKLKNDKELTQKTGANAKKCAARDFDKNYLAQKMLSGILDLHENK